MARFSLIAGQEVEQVMNSPTKRCKKDAPTKRVLVAGATGYLGGFVAQELKARGDFVRALAFDAAGKRAKIARIPEWLMWWTARLVRLFSKHQGELLAFFTTMATTDVVAPSTGTRTLEDHFRQLGGRS